MMDFAIDTDIAYHNLLFQELEVSAFLVVFVLIITLSRTDYQCQVIKVAASALTRVFLPLCTHTCTIQAI